MQCSNFSGIHATAHLDIFSKYVNPAVCCPEHCEGNCNDCLLSNIDGNDVDLPKSCDRTKNNICSQRGHECCTTHIPNDSSGYCSPSKSAPCRLGKFLAIFCKDS